VRAAEDAMGHSLPKRAVLQKLFGLDVPRRRRRRVTIVVDNRRFLLGLDELYRQAIKPHERAELLVCARDVAKALNVEPAREPVEGYYGEDAELTAYFQLVRALQAVTLQRSPEVESLPAFQRLLDVTSSGIYGAAVRKHLLPQGRDPLSEALRLASSDAELTVPSLTASAARIARETDDYSLVGLACRAMDPVVIAALRESVVLYAEPMELAMCDSLSPKYVWRVDPEVSVAAHRFVDTFNALFRQELPLPIEKNAHIYGRAVDEYRISGRCVRLGQTDGPERCYYHWAITPGADGGLTVDEFWASEIWTTNRYRRGKGARTGLTVGPRSADT